MKLMRQVCLQDVYSYREELMELWYLSCARALCIGGDLRAYFIQFVQNTPRRLSFLFWSMLHGVPGCVVDSYLVSQLGLLKLAVRSLMCSL